MSLPLQPIVNVVVRTGPLAASASDLNMGLILGISSVIPLSERVRKYSSVSAMTTDGFAIDSPEVRGAMLYFGQTPRPYALIVGVCGEEETMLEGLMACRIANGEWYAVSVLDATSTEIEEISGYIETSGVEMPMVHMYTTDDPEVLVDGGMLAKLKQQNYRRTFGVYSTTPYAACSAMGYAMGSNTGAANSASTLNLKPTPGVIPEVLTESQYDRIRLNNGNVTVNRGGKFNILQEGTMASGVFFDEVLGIDLTAIQIQMAVMNLLTTSAKVPQTEEGVSRLISVIVPPCEAARLRGLIAPGIWTGDPILALQPGDALPSGYNIQSERVADQSQADREARRAPNIYVALKLAGAVHSATIMVDVNR